MMKTILLASAAALLAASAASAQAPEGLFKLGAGYTFLDADDAEFDALTVRGGYDFVKYFGVEGEALIGLGEESVNVGGLAVDTSLNYGLGLFAKAHYPFTEQLSAFARVGYVWAEIEAESAGVSLTDDEDGAGYGAGVEYTFDGVNAIRGEYTLYDYGDDAEIDGWSLSYVRRF